MSDLFNPFSPFITALAIGDSGNAHVQSPFGGPAGTIHSFGTSQLLQDEFGRHVGTINHLTDGFATLTDGMGSHAGTVHSFGGTTEVSDRMGSPEAYIHHGVGGHDTIENAQHQIVATVDHMGPMDIINDPMHGVVETVSSDLS